MKKVALKHYCVRYMRGCNKDDLGIYTFFIYDTNKENAIKRFVNTTIYLKKDIVDVKVL